MSFWARAKVALNSTIGTSRFKAIDQIIAEERYNLMQTFSKMNDTYNKSWFFIPKGMKNIPSNFLTDDYLNAKSIVNVVFLPFSIESIEDACFNGFDALKEIIIPENGKFKTIGQEVFSGCGSLQSIELPSTLEFIGQNCFEGCPYLKTIIFQNTIEQWNEIILWFGIDWYGTMSNFTVFCTNGYIEYERGVDTVNGNGIVTRYDAEEQNVVESR